jgi:hypothetical protein
VAPKCKEIEIREHNYDDYILECSLPCDWSYGDDGHPVQIPCKFWDSENKGCSKTGIWYQVLLNGCALIWEDNSKQTAKVLSIVLRDISERNSIQFKSFDKEVS